MREIGWLSNPHNDVALRAQALERIGFDLRSNGTPDLAP
jgi:hypothetical protein